MAVRALLARHRTPAAFLGGVVTAALLGSGVALAAIPSTVTGSITGCVNRTSGAVRIIDFQAGKRCTSKETTLSWSKGLRYRGAWSARSSYSVLDVVTYLGSAYVAKAASTNARPGSSSLWGVLSTKGATGLRGATGATGATGPQGLQGIQGLQGLQGLEGIQGLQGIQGLPGLDGVDGLNGLDGAMGPAGATGLQGPQGLQGLQGLQGPVGETGPAGPQGATGPQGPAGASGATGPAGPQGPAGVLGRTVVTLVQDVGANQHAVLDPQCPSGTVPIGGGAHVGSTYAGWASTSVAYIGESDLDDAGTGWASTAVTTSSASGLTTFTAHVVCVSAAQ